MRLSRFNLPRNFNYHLLFTMLTVRMFPPIVTVIPLFAFYNREILGYKLFDTQLGLGLIHGFMELPLVLWMMIGFFRDIPRDMEEAALVDGDSRLAVLRKIAIPLAAPGSGGHLHPRLHLLLERVPAGADPHRLAVPDAADRGRQPDHPVRRQVGQHDGRRRDHDRAGADPGAA